MYSKVLWFKLFMKSYPIWSIRHKIDHPTNQMSNLTILRGKNVSLLKWFLGNYFKLGTVTASDMGMHHVLMTLTLTFIQCHTGLTHENNKCFIIIETVQAMPIFTVKIVRLKIYIILSQSDDLDLHSRSQLGLKHDKFLTCLISNISNSI